MKCLIVDDVEVTLMTAEHILSEMNIDCITAHTIDDATAVLNQQKIDIMLVDWNLGRVTADPLLKKAHEINDNIKIIVISGVTGEENKQEILQAGANVFLEKPTTKEALQRGLKQAGISV